MQFHVYANYESISIACQPPLYFKGNNLVTSKLFAQ